MRKSRKTLGRAKPDVLMPVPDTLAGIPEGYPVLLSGIKEIITRERIKPVMSANVAMVLKTAFPDMTGFSPRNLKYMRKFADAWPDRTIVQRTVAQLPWWNIL